MEPFVKHSGLVIPLDRTNVNTDEIIPARFLNTIKRAGFADALFANWRFLSDDQPNADFVLNFPRYQGASILIAGDNFGCGSSREHAPWALHDYGLRCIIAPGFADIFYNNCFNNSILPIILDEALVKELFKEIEAQEGYTLAIDLEQQTVTTPRQGNHKGLPLQWNEDTPQADPSSIVGAIPCGCPDGGEAYLSGVAPTGRVLRFEVDQFRKQALLNGLDNIGWTLSHDDEISRYEERRKQEAPWLFA